MNMSRNSSSTNYGSKRRRSRTRSREYTRKHRKISPEPSSSQNTDEEFSFMHYKRSLNKIILYSSESNTVANNLEDFWVFLKKYEATLRNAGKPILEQRCGEQSGFSKSHCINFNTKLKYMDTASDDRGWRKLDKNIFEAFLNVVSIYLDFKNKEKFEKLKKLRQTQRDLPVAKYR